MYFAIIVVLQDNKYGADSSAVGGKYRSKFMFRKVFLNFVRIYLA